MVSKDITALLYAIKENIQTIESGDAGNAPLDEVRADFLALIELIKLFLISERDSYYGYFLMNMQVRVNFFSNNIAGVRLNEFPPVFESNPLLLCKFALKEIMYIVCHEIDHIVLNHPAEMVKANPGGDRDIFYKFNLAADAAVNDRINYEINTEHHGFLTQPEGVVTSSVLSALFQLGIIRAMESYAYYFALIADEPVKKASNSGKVYMLERRQKTDEEKKAGPDSVETACSPADVGAYGGRTPDHEAIVTAASCGGKVSDHDWGIENEEEATAAVKELVNAAVDMMNQETRGLMPALFVEEVERINKPPVLSWQLILKKYVGTITADKRKTRKRLNRRQPERFDLSGTVDDKVLKIVVAIDTSASVSNEMISRIMNEIFAILAKRKHEITIIECDSKVQRVYRVHTSADLQNKVAGRGGTAFSPVIEYINRDKYFRDALLIYFTDGFGEDKIPRPRTYRNLWVILEDVSYLSVTEPYGMVLSL